MISTGHNYCTEPNWSPDGKKIAFNVRGGGGFEVAVLDLSGSVTRIISTGENPVWGADSRHLMFTEGGGLYLLDTVTSRKSKVLDGVVDLARSVGLPAESRDSIEAALAAVARLDLAPAPRILITGSLYLAGEVLALNGTPPT